MRLALILLLSVGPAARLAAQVGHDPAASPYRDLWTRQALNVRVGYLGGSHGLLGVGPAGGRAIGLGYEISLGGAVQFHAGVTHAALKRFITDSVTIDTVGGQVDTVDHRRGPFDMDLLTADAQLVLALSGQKTWHRLAPYAGVGVGYSFRLSGDLPARDSTGFEFGTRFTLTPMIGTKVYLTRHLVGRLEVRDHIWRLIYPLQYSAGQTGGDLPLLLPSDPDAEWTHHLLFSVGVGWTF